MIRAILLPALACAAFGSLTNGLSAQNAKQRAAAYVVLGDSLLRAGDLNGSERAFHDALLAQRGNRDALKGLGRIAYVQRDWTQVRRRANDVLESAPSDPEAHYLAGVADREIGRTRPPLVNDLLEWRRARSHFDAVVAVDSSYRDVLYQYALLKAYQGGRSNWEEALDLVNRQLRLRPESMEGHVGAYQLYRRFVERWDDAITGEWLLRMREVPYARASAATIERRAGRLQESEDVLVVLASSPDECTAISGLLGLARLYAANNEDERAERAFSQAVGAIESVRGASLVFEDLKYIATDEELDTFREASTRDPLQSFFRRFWASRNPIPAADRNPRLLEHYRRLEYADRYFVYYGYRGWVNNPDKLGYLDFPAVYDLNERYNDKGLVYLRHGEPDDRIISMGASTDPNESWKYYGGQGQAELEFHFVIEEHTSGGNNWRLTAILDDPQMLLDRVDWGSRYYQMYNASTDRRRRLDAGLLEIEMGERSRDFVRSGMSTDRHSWETPPEPLPFWYQIFTARADSGKTFFELMYLTPMRELAPGSEPGSEVVLEAGVIMHDAAWGPVARRTSEERYLPDPASGDVVLGSFAFAVEPETYHVAVHALVRGTNRLAGWKFDETVRDYSGSEGMISDLVAAYEVRTARPDESSFVRNGLRVLPNPSRRYFTTRPVYFYFEIYNLTFGADDRTRFRLRYTLEPAERGRGRLLGLFRRTTRPVLSLEFDRDGMSTTSIEHGQLDVSGVEPGDYSLEVTVTDEVTGREFSRRMPIILTRPPSDQ